MPIDSVYPKAPAGLSRLEAETLRTLRLGLWEGWRVFPKVHLPDVGNHRADSDLDFVLLHPRHGIHIIEAKDCEVRNLSQAPVATYETSTGQKNKDLSRQLRGQRRVLSEFLDVPESGVGSCLWAPHGEESLQGFSGTIRNPELGEGFRFVRGPSIAPHFQHLQTLEQPPARFDSVLNTLIRIAEEAETEASLRPFEPGEPGVLEQKRFLRARTKHRAVTGVAGTGKTQVLLREARTLAEQGGQVLMLCYNERLAEALGRSLEGAGVRLLKMDDLAREFLGEAYVDPQGEKSGDYESQFIDVAEAIRANPRWLAKLTHILVDEAQDLSGAQLMALSAAQAASRCYLTIAHDPTQKWRQQGADLEDFTSSAWEGAAPWEAPFQLKNNLRNGSSIRRLAREFLGSLVGADAAESMMGLDQNREGKNHAPDPKTIPASAIVGELEKVLGRREAPDSTLILSSDSRDWLRGGKGRTPGIFPPSHADGVETALRAKGLEAKVVVAFLRDDRNHEKPELRELAWRRAYLAATRATHAFYLFWVRA